MNSLGLLYSTGEANRTEAFYWHEKASEAGNVASMAALGVMYQQGCGTPKNQRLALEWLKAAAERGSLQGQGHLAEHYLRMHLYNKAVQWASRVAAREIDVSSMNVDDRQCYALGIWILGRCKQQGHGTDPSVADAKRLMQRAAEVDRETVYQLRSQVLAGHI